jgi:microcystin degradation protein MlrC
MRVFSGSIATETNTFGPMPTGLASFKDRGYFPAGQPTRATVQAALYKGAKVEIEVQAWVGS